MRYFVLLIVFGQAIMSCSNEGHRIDVDFRIEEGLSYEVDLKSKLYMVHFMSRPVDSIQFELSNEEQAEINKMFYDLNINEIADSIIKDNCQIMPKVYTTLLITEKAITRKISIDSSCDDFGFGDGGKASSFKKFLKQVHAILQSKPVIKAAPKSDIIYM